MKKRALILVVAAACGGSQKTAAPSSQPSAATFTPAQIAEKALPSVVLIKTGTQLGTGFVVWQDGRIVTNLHVIAGATEASVLLNDGREFNRVEVLAADARHDLVVLRVPVRDLKPLKLGDSHAVKPGERVVAIGHPLGLGNTVSDGLVSGVRDLEADFTLLQISAPIAAGSSGGPIFNDRAEVIGVATLYSMEGQNLNFGVPVQYVRPLLLSDKPISLAELNQQIDRSLFDGCSLDDVKLAVTAILDAIQIGVPLYNNGNEQACFDTYQKAALDIVGKLKNCKGVREALLAGVTKANEIKDPGKKAWALRHAFDAILNAVDEAVKQGQKSQKK